LGFAGFWGNIILEMSQHLRQTVVGFIWPGPIAGPLPINFFRVLSPLLVFYLHPVLAALIMGFLTTLLSIFYFRLLELTGGKEYVTRLLSRLPKKTQQRIETKGPFTLFTTSILTGVFAYAIFLKTLRYPKTNSEILLLAASFVGSIIWTGIFWGSAVEIVKRGTSFAF
jgi:hypothetical protein